MTRPRTPNGVRRRREALNAAMVRKCCLTGLLEQHLPGCVRPKSRCAAKVGWATRDKAIESARRVESAFGRMTAYRCSGCGAWHIGHPKTAAEGLES